MKLNFLLWAVLIFATQACTPQTNDIKQNKFDIEQFNKYKVDLKEEYRDFKIEEQKERTIDFIKMYFRSDSLYSKYEYSIKYETEFFALAKGQYNSVFYSELIHFEKSNEIDNVIKYIKEHNTIDPNNLKLHRIFRVGENTIICVNYSGFDIANYENFLMKEFNKSLNIEVINPSY
jgi:hypothetical protein